MVYGGVFGRPGPRVGILGIGLLAVLIFGNTPTPQLASATATVSIDAAVPIGTSATQVATQLVWPTGLDGAAVSRFGALGYSLVRVSVDTDSVTPPLIPAGHTKGDWNFEPLNQLLNVAFASGARPVLDIDYPPEWMWDCSRSPGVVRDPTFTEFGDYMARVVAYYNQGSFVAEDGRTITNPNGTANRIRYWELWNEPMFESQVCLFSSPGVYRPKFGQKLNPAQYLTMWNAVSAKMLAVDPTLVLVGPTSGYTPEYIAPLMARAVHKPDVISIHFYGGYSDVPDQEFFNELQVALDGIAQIQALAPGRPIWITELGVNSSGADGPGRPLSGFGAAWTASAFRSFVLAGVGTLYQYAFRHLDNPQLSLLDPATNQPLLAYWRDYYLSRYFPPGSTLLQASSSLPGVEVLAARPPGSTSVRMLVVNRQTNGATVVGGPGVPTTVDVSVAGLGGARTVTQRMLDSSTPLAAGPPLVTLSSGSGASVTFSGYGAALLEFGGSVVPTPTPTPTVAPTTPPPPPTQTPFEPTTPPPPPTQTPFEPTTPPPPPITPNNRSAPPTSTTPASNSPHATTPTAIARADAAPSAALSGFHSRSRAQHVVVRTLPGRTAAFTFEYLNTGTETWVRGKPEQRVMLGVRADDPRFAPLAIGWPSADRVALQREDAVPPGAAGTFTFRVRAPEALGTYEIPLRPVVDGVGWLDDEAVVARLQVVQWYEAPDLLVADAIAFVESRAETLLLILTVVAGALAAMSLAGRVRRRMTT